MTIRRRVFLAALTAALLVPAQHIARAADYPQRPVQISMQYPAGSGPDGLLRRLGDSLGRRWAQPLVIVNKPGANGWLAAMDVRQAAADGHTLLVTDNTATALQPLLLKKIPFDPLKDFEPVAPLFSTYFFIVVAHDSPWKTIGDLLAAARAANGEQTVGSFGTASVNQFGIASFEDATTTRLTMVPYKTLPDLFNDVSAGRVAWAFGTAGSVAPYLQSKRLRLLAVAAPKRVAGFEAVPTMAEAGGPAGFELKTWLAVYAPKGTPRAVTQRIEEAVSRAMGETAAVEYLAASGFERWSGTADDVAAATVADRARFAAVMRRANILPQ